jgi:CO/xanthine dehydrogenase Mo-binding subunit
MAKPQLKDSTEPRPRIDSEAKVTGQAKYTEDLPDLPGMIYGAMLLSPYSHARILSIDSSKAEKLPGVLAVLYRDRLEGINPVRPLAKFVEEVDLPDDQPFIAIDKVRFDGEVVAAVAAETLAAARRAAELIDVRYESLPPLFDPAEALSPGAVLLHEQKKTNLVFEDHLGWGDVSQGFREADQVFEEVFSSPTMFHHPIENVGVSIAQFVGGEVTLWTPTNTPFNGAHEIGRFFGIDNERVRIRVPYIGGHFGAKGISNPILAALFLSKKTARPVKLVPSIGESFRQNARHAMVYRAKIGVKSDGTLTALDVDLLVDTGAYTTAAVTATHNMVVGSRGAYHIPHFRSRARCAYTNKVPAGHARSTGHVQSTWAIESAMDQVARKMGIDPYDFKKKNTLRRGAVVARGTIPLDTDLDQLMEKAVGAIQWNGRASVQSADPGNPAPTSRWVKGHGLSVSLRPGSRGGGRTYAMATVDGRGRVRLQHNAPDPGQGTHNLFSIIASRTLGIPQSEIEVSDADTAVNLPFSGVTAQRTTVQMGSAVQNACDNLKRELLAAACAKKGGKPEEWQMVQGRLVWGETSFSFGDIVRSLGENSNLKCVGFYDPLPRVKDSVYGGIAHFSPGVAAVEVEVDSATGEFRLLQYAIVLDAGKLLHPPSAKAQMQGGAIMGLGHALFEETVYQESQLQNADPFQYRLSLMSDIPESFQGLAVENGDGPGPFGSKGMSQTSIVTVAPAVGNAIADALGIRVRALPITPEKILRALGKL